jgi:hypothetical protein
MGLEWVEPGDECRILWRITWKEMPMRATRIYGTGDVRAEAVPGSSERQALKVLIQL